MLLFIQNDPEVPPGTYGDFIKDTGIPYVVTKAFMGGVIPPLAAVSAVITLGGSMSVYDEANYPFLVAVKDYIGQLVQLRKPYLGICLGGQLLADVLRAEVHTNINGEIGPGEVSLTAEGAEDPLFQSLPKRFVTFQWHNDSFAIPEGATRLGGSAVSANQAFRFREKLYGLQFHPEVDEQIVAAWCAEFDCRDVFPEDIVAEFKACKPDYHHASLQILKNFLKIAQVTP